MAIPQILDPLAKVYYQLAISDILRTVQVEERVDVFKLNDHVVINVDVIGVIRCLQEKERFYNTELDDGTGVIECTIWKNTSILSSGDQSRLSPDEQLLVTSLQKELNRATRCPEIGDSIHLRGKLKKFREILQISAGYYRFLVNCNESLQRMIDLDELRNTVYKEYSETAVNKCVEQMSAMSIVNNIIKEICSVLDRDHISRFSIADLCLHDSVIELLQSHSNNMLSGNLRTRFQAILWKMVELGHVFPAITDVGNEDLYVYAVGDSQLKMEICCVLKRLESSQSAMDYGVSMFSALKDIRKSNHYRRLTKESIKMLFDHMLEQGIIYSTGWQKYKLV